MAVDNVSFKGLVTSINSAKNSYGESSASEALDQRYLDNLLGVNLEDVVDVQKIKLPKEGIFRFSPVMYRLRLKNGELVSAQKGTVNFDRQVQLPNGKTIDHYWSLVSPSNPETRDAIRQIFTNFKKISKGISN